MSEDIKKIYSFAVPKVVVSKPKDILFVLLESLNSHRGRFNGSVLTVRDTDGRRREATPAHGTLWNKKAV